MKPPKIDHLVRSKRKTIALIVRPDASLEVRAPTRLPMSAIQQFIQEKTPWIQKHQEQVQANLAAAKNRRYASGETFLYLGRVCPLVAAPAQRASLDFKDGVFYLKAANVEQAERVFTEWYRRQARREIEQRCAAWAALLNLEYSAIRIGSARTRWGSCNSKAALSFTWRLVMAPAAIIDYVIVHELIHIRERSHSKKYWEQVAAVMPDYRQRRQWLTVYGPRLDLAVNAAELK